MIYFWEENRFVDAGWILKRDKFHGFAISGVYRLAGDWPSYGGYLPTNRISKILGSHMIQVFQGVLIKIEWVDRNDKAEGLNFVLQPEPFRVWAWVMLPLLTTSATRRELAGSGKQAEGFIPFFLIEEAKGFPHEAGSCGTMGDAVKAASLDQDPDILEVEM